MDAKLKKAVELVEASDDFKLLRRIKPDLLPRKPSAAGDLLGLFVDVETTGLDTKKDQIIELGMVPFIYDPKSEAILRVSTPFHSYQEPTVPIPPLITKITGIDADKVRGSKIEWKSVTSLVSSANLIVAHHAEFDRQMLERYCPAFELLPWACSMSQIPWQDEGINGKRLEYVAGALDHFYDAHTAIADCQAALFCIDKPLPSGRTGFSYLLGNANGEGRHIWAINAPFQKKDELKGRGYYWSDGEDGKPKAWHKEVTMEAYVEEVRFLQETIYRTQRPPIQVTKITPFNRFSART